LIVVWGYISPVGAGSDTTTAICTVAVLAPSALEAVTVYDAFVVAAVGVPEIIPVELLRLSPAGRAGLTV
jgi:hypothetical protein